MQAAVPSDAPPPCLGWAHTPPLCDFYIAPGSAWGVQRAGGGVQTPTDGSCRRDDTQHPDPPTPTHPCSLPPQTPQPTHKHTTRHTMTTRGTALALLALLASAQREFFF